MKFAPFLLLLAVGFPSSALAEEQYGANLSREVQMATVVTVSDGGDIDLFGGTFVVPLERPSVHRCGEHISKPARVRANEISKARSKANDEAIKRRFSPRERHEYTNKAVAPLKQCDKQLAKRCGEIRTQVPLDLRKAAVEQAKKQIERIPKGPEEKKQVLAYLENVLADCPLSQ